ncbi:MAG: hypothetical protein FJW26_10665 [Acidimicrobiia bacterium]|nr:hypothetical protein [Acidimicrobiia bacterium]
MRKWPHWQGLGRPAGHWDAPPPRSIAAGLRRFPTHGRLFSRRGQAHDKAEEIRVERARVLDATYTANPKRFINGARQPAAFPTAAWIHKPDTKEDAQ